jgi:hypothetical protein
VTARAERAVAFGLVVLGAAVVLLGSGRSSGGTPGVAAATGSGRSDGAAALALVALAGAGAALIVRTGARRLLGVALVLVAAAMVGVGVDESRWAPVAGGVMVAVGALVITLRAGRWPAPRDRFDRPAGPAGPAGPADGPRDAWDALDRGEDPTA